MAGRWAALAVIFLTRVSMGVQFQSVAAAGPVMVDDLGLSWARLGTLIGLYMLPGVVFALLGAVIGQRVGERRAVLGGLALMLGGGLVSAFAGGFAVAAAGRLVSGSGAILMNILLARMVADWFTGKEMATAMAVMLTAWPVGLGLAAATLGDVAAVAGWRAATLVAAGTAAAGLVLMAAVYRDAPARGAPAAGAALARRELGLALAGGAAGGVFNGSRVVVVAFGPAMLLARGLSLGDAGGVVSLALWVTILSVPLGGLLADRLRRPDLLIVLGTAAAALIMALLPALPAPVVAFCLVGLVIGLPPGPLMALLPKALAPDRLTSGLGVFYASFYVVMAVAQPAAGLVRDLTGAAAAPMAFAAVVMALTLVGLLAFRLVERASAR